MMFVRSSTNLLHFVMIWQNSWLPLVIHVSDWLKLYKCFLLWTVGTNNVLEIFRRNSLFHIYSAEIPCFIYFAEIPCFIYTLQKFLVSYTLQKFLFLNGGNYKNLVCSYTCTATSPNDFYLSTCDICTVLYRDASFSQKPQTYLFLNSEEIPRWVIQAHVSL
jgi:hypothetical protein